MLEESKDSFGLCGQTLAWRRALSFVSVMNRHESCESEAVTLTLVSYQASTSRCHAKPSAGLDIECWIEEDQMVRALDCHWLDFQSFLC